MIVLKLASDPRVEKGLYARSSLEDGYRLRRLKDDSDELLEGEELVSYMEHELESEGEEVPLLVRTLSKNKLPVRIRIEE